MNQNRPIAREKRLNRQARQERQEKNILHLFASVAQKFSSSSLALLATLAVHFVFSVCFAVASPSTHHHKLRPDLLP
ncbi:MAG TPA: hypothetical protein VGG44_08410, partial [Tepidisphaeraceae bacterium]